MAFRFVHTADIHLDSPLKSLALRNPDLAALVETATRETFERIVRLCLEEDIDALLIAGDLYDGDQTSIKTAGFLSANLRKLADAGVTVCIIRGNHDAQARITDKLDLPPEIKTFSNRSAETVTLTPSSGPAIAIHGTSFPKGQVPKSLLPRFDTPVAGAVNIGLLHTSLNGAEGHDVYAPCSLTDLSDHGFDYWALGHIHARQVHAEAPFVVMPGIPQGRHVNEAGPKSVTLGAVDDAGAIAIEERFLAGVSFARVDATVTGGWAEARAAVEAALAGARANGRAERLIARVSLKAEGDLAWRLRRDADQFRAEIEAGAPDIWIEGLTVESAAAPTAAGPVADIARLMTEISASDGFQAEARAMLEEMAAALPKEARDALGADAAAQAALAETLAAEGVAEALTRLGAADEDG